MRRMLVLPYTLTLPEIASNATGEQTLTMTSNEFAMNEGPETGPEWDPYWGGVRTRTRKRTHQTFATQSQETVVGKRRKKAKDARKARKRER